MNVRQIIVRVAGSLEEADLFYGHGTDNSSDESAWLVLHTMGAPLDGSFSGWEQTVTAEQEFEIMSLLQRRIKEAMPLAYLLGSSWFAGLEFEVNCAVLVPRSPIAELILEEFEPWLTAGSLGNALDLCTGCGCIAIAMAVHMPWLQVDASDISPEALEIAARNVERHRLADRVKLFQSDLFADLPGSRYDLIVSNPPYVADSSMPDLPPEYRAEPSLGLVSGADGLDACLDILLQAPDFLNNKGVLVCEVGESEHALRYVLPSVPFVWLEFSQGGSGVFVLTREELLQSAQTIKTAIEERRHVT